ncbi:MAG: hypothetical protein JWO45_1115, partial [Spartobacteria bacterium]|nr:hypothetical protein [Spartobacteria bacterium]
TSKPIEAHRGLIHAARPAAPNGSIAEAAGNHVSTVCEQRPADPTFPITPATISASGLPASASKGRTPLRIPLFRKKKDSRQRVHLAHRKLELNHAGLNRNFVRPRFAFAFALRRLFCEGVSNARKRRTSSRMPSASSLFFKRFSARSTGSPLRTMTSGIDDLSLV